MWWQERQKKCSELARQINELMRELKALQDSCDCHNDTNGLRPMCDVCQKKLGDKSTREGGG